MAELRADIEKKILDEKQNGIDRAFENAAIEKAVANMTVEIPDSMVEEELDHELERMDYEPEEENEDLEYKRFAGSLRQHDGRQSGQYPQQPPSERAEHR